jgi:hypothetical protein
MKTNSQTLLSSRIYLGDIDGDQLDEILEVDGRHLYIFKCNYDHTPVLEHVFASPVKRLIIGDYVISGRERGKDQIFAILEDGSIQGWAISDNLKEMWWWFTQPSFIKDTDHFIVGDFDGDGADEIMVYAPSTGIIKLYKFQSNGLLGEMSGYKLGNMEGRDLRNKVILAGDFGQAALRQDILVVDRTAGQITRFDTATDNDGKTTFWWAFTSASNLFGNTDELIVSNINGSAREGLVIRNANNGQYKLFQLDYNDGKLTEAAGVDVGQLPIQPGRGRIAAAKVREPELRNEQGIARDDILYFNDSSCEIIRTDARFDAARNRFIYWWAYTSPIVVEPVRIAEKKPFAVILCRFKGMPINPAIEKFFREIFSPGAGGLVEYWHDVSLGKIDISGSRVIGWIEIDLERKDAGSEKRRRTELIDIAISSAQKAGHDVTTNFFKQIAVFAEDWSKDGAPAGADWSDKLWGGFWIDGSKDGFGRISAPPHGHNGSFLAHEMGHSLEYDHDLAANLKTNYGDIYCIMSAMNVAAFNHPVWNVPFGPTMSFPQLANKNWMLTRRVLTINSNWVDSATATNFTLAPMSDRKINANIGVILPTADNNPDWQYYLEYQRPIGWNRGISPRLVIRRRLGNTAAYLGEVIIPTILGDKASWTEPSGKVKFEVEKVRNDERTINVSVTRLAGVVVYEHSNYAGRRQVLDVGRYDIGQLSIGNDVISSVKVPPGWKVKLYQHSSFQGAQKILTADTHFLSDFNDTTSSIVIERI